MPTEPLVLRVLALLTANDAAYMDIDRNRLSLRGLFDELHIDRFPSVCRFVIFVSTTGTQGPIDVRVTLAGPGESGPTIWQGRYLHKAKHPEAAVEAVFRVGHMLTSPGRYYVRVLQAERLVAQRSGWFGPEEGR